MAPSNKVRDYLNRDMWEHPILRPFAKILIPIQQTIIFGSVVFFLIELPLGLYMILEKSGWVPNNHETPVWIQGDWLVGESRSCQMRTKTAPDREKKLDSVDKLPRLFCGEDANGLFDFQTTLVSPPADVQVPKQGSMYYKCDWWRN